MPGGISCRASPPDSGRRQALDRPRDGAGAAVPARIEPEAVDAEDLAADEAAVPRRAPNDAAEAARHDAALVAALAGGLEDRLAQNARVRHPRDGADGEQAALPLPAELATVEAAPVAVAVLVGGC